MMKTRSQAKLSSSDSVSSETRGYNLRSRNQAKPINPSGKGRSGRNIGRNVHNTRSNGSNRNVGNTGSLQFVRDHKRDVSLEQSDEEESNDDVEHHPRRSGRHGGNLAPKPTNRYNTRQSSRNYSTSRLSGLPPPSPPNAPATRATRATRVTRGTRLANVSNVSNVANVANVARGPKRRTGTNRQNGRNNGNNAAGSRSTQNSQSTRNIQNSPARSNNQTNQSLTPRKGLKRGLTESEKQMHTPPNKRGRKSPSKSSNSGSDGAPDSPCESLAKNLSTLRITRHTRHARQTRNSQRTRNELNSNSSTSNNKNNNNSSSSSSNSSNSFDTGDFGVNGNDKFSQRSGKNGVKKGLGAARMQTNGKCKPKPQTRAKTKTSTKSGSNRNNGRRRGPPAKVADSSDASSDAYGSDASDCSDESENERDSENDSKPGRKRNLRASTRNRANGGNSRRREETRDVRDGSEEKELSVERGVDWHRENILKIKDMLLTQEFNFELKARDEEYNKIWSFFMTHLKARQGGSYYICGSPGTGKSATLYAIEKKLNTASMRAKHNIKLVFKLNAMSLQTPQSIYTVLYEMCLGSSNRNVSPQAALPALQSFFVSNTRGGRSSKNRANEGMAVVIIDEMDGLLGQYQSVLYQLFSWCQSSGSRLLLVGIANSIDLTDRFLPKLRARKIEPPLLIFKPYNKKQLLDILVYRLTMIGGSDGANEVPYFEQIALQLCAQKVAKMFGDVRKCLEICRACLDVLICKIDAMSEVEQEQEQQVWKVAFPEMNRVLNQAFGSPVVDVIRSLPNNQTVLLVVATILSKYSQNDGTQTPYVTYNKLEAFYQYMCQKYRLHQTSKGEFQLIIDSLVTGGICGVARETRESRGLRTNAAMQNSFDTRLNILVPRDDIAFAVRENEQLTKFLESDCLVPPKYR